MAEQQLMYQAVTEFLMVKGLSPKDIHTRLSSVGLYFFLLQHLKSVLINRTAL